MTVVIGTDEAGYGPNLGPLVVAATAWRVAAEPVAVEAALAAVASETAANAGGILWGDSKQIHRGGAGLAALERGVLAALALAGGGEPSSGPQLAAALGIQGWAAMDRPDVGNAGAVPTHRHQPACSALAGQLRGPLDRNAVALQAIRCRVVEPAEFNSRLDRGLNKSDILSEVTLGLAAMLLATADEGEPVVVWCDRHGGRRRYAALVSRAFDDPLVQPLDETAERSCYRFGTAHRIEFSVGGEARLPVALASMTAKYVRELAMLAFNEFWQRRQPGLATTAGYPVDARRWRQEAAVTVAAAGIPWDAIWRRA